MNSGVLNKTRSTRRDSLVVLLAFAGASVDAISYLALGHVFTANMTGNTILLVVALIENNTQGLLRSGLALAGYIMGTAAGAAIAAGSKKEEEWPPRVNIILGAELAALIVFGAIWLAAGTPMPPAITHTLIVLSAATMGAQSVAVHRLRVGYITTTHITGMIVGLTTSVVNRLRGVQQENRQSDEGPILPAVTWIVYVGGALASAVVEQRWHQATILLPLAAILVVMIWGWILDR